jgi:hypothetical protein
MLKQRAQTTELELEHHKELPLHICKLLPLSQITHPLNQWSNATQNATKSKNLLNMHRAVRPLAPDLTASTRYDRLGAVRPLQETGPAPNCPKFDRTSWNSFQTLPGAQSMHKLLPLVDNTWINAKCEKFQHVASQIYKIHHKDLHKSKWAS